jgi:hypothetical protein
MTKFLKKLQSMEIHTIFRIKKELRESLGEDSYANHGNSTNESRVIHYILNLQ